MTRPFARHRIACGVGGRTAGARCRRFLDGAVRSIASGVPDEWRVKTLRECDGADLLLTGGIARWKSVENIRDRAGQRA